MTSTAISPVERIHRFIDELRARGIPVSMTERIDAMRAAQIADFGKADGLRTALCCTLVKAAEHLGVFDEVFDLYFQPPVAQPVLRERLAGGALAGGDASESEETAGRAAGEPAPAATLNLEHAVRAVLRGGADELAQRVAEQGVAEFARFEAGRAVAGVMYEQWTLAALRLDELVAQRLAEVEAAGGGPAGRDAPGRGLRLQVQRTEITDRAALLRGHVRKVIRELLVADRGPDAVAKTLRQPLTADIDISLASKEQLLEIQRVMEPLERKLATTMMRKRRNRTGPINVRATLRASMATGGVPVRVVHHRPRPTKPQLYVLADMSGSVATFAAFTVTLISAMSQLYSRLRSFAFIQDAAEITDLFRHARDPARAVAAIGDYVTANELGGYTDYGRALRQFHGAVGRQLERRSTVLIFGDARGNYLPSEEATLSKIAKRAGSVYWLNPEPGSLWNSGDSMMRAYQPHCTAAVTCRTLNDLRQFIEQLA
jgi:uncharacterized protein with von Willebrand factor type A (vWA) domain